jgi:hypothetical protein
LIFDNADDPDLVKGYRPIDPNGHILLTSRAQVFHVLGIPEPIMVEEMTPEEALAFLRRGVGMIAEAVLLHEIEDILTQYLDSDAFD